MVELLTKGEYAYRRLHEDILSGKLPAGSRLVVKDLVEQYQVSPMPIRSAISRLEELGFVHSQPHQGAWVAEMNMRDYFTFMTLRIEAEALATYMAAGRRDDALIEELESIQAQMEAAREVKDYETYGRMNRKAHSLVCEASDNPTLIEHINTLLARTQLAVSFFSIVPQASEASCQEHRDWIDALRKRDARRSAAILRYQRCRSNLGLIDAVQKGGPTVLNNPFLRQADTQEGRRCMEDFIPIFESIQRENDYRNF